MNQREEAALRGAIVSVLRANVWPLGWKDVSRRVRAIAEDHRLGDLPMARSVEIASSSTKLVLKRLVDEGLVVTKDEPVKAQSQTRSGRPKWVKAVGYTLAPKEGS